MGFKHVLIYFFHLSVKLELKNALKTKRFVYLDCVYVYIVSSDHNNIKHTKLVKIAKFDLKDWLKIIDKNMVWRDLAKNRILQFFKLSFLLR